MVSLLGKLLKTPQGVVIYTCERETPGADGGSLLFVTRKSDRTKQWRISQQRLGWRINSIILLFAKNQQLSMDERLNPCKEAFCECFHQKACKNLYPGHLSRPDEEK